MSLQIIIITSKLFSIGGDQNQEDKRNTGIKD